MSDWLKIFGNKPINTSSSYVGETTSTTYDWHYYYCVGCGTQLVYKTIEEFYGYNPETGEPYPTRNVTYLTCPNVAEQTENPHSVNLARLEDGTLFFNNQYAVSTGLSFNGTYLPYHYVPTRDIPSI